MDDQQIIGGKADSLNKLTGLGHKVPSFHILDVSYFDRYHATNKTIPNVDKDFILDLITKFDGKKLAIRSSATKEDGLLTSFAGLFETYLNVEGDTNVIEAIEKCFKSIDSDRIRSYCERNKIQVSEIKMAVILQEYIEPDYAGVIFSVNPISGCDQEILIEMCAGSGEKLVSGQISPSRYTLNKEIKNYIVKNEDSLKLNIDEKLLTRLQVLTLELQSKYGMPIDIEFAIKNNTIYLLQARAITKIQFSKEIGEWTTSDFRDGGVSSAVVSPIMWSLYGQIFSSTIAKYFIKLHLIKEERAKYITWYKVFYGRPYWNLRAIKDIQEELPGYNERNFDRDMALPINYEGDGVTTGFSIKGIIKALPVLSSLHKEYKSQEKRCHELLANFNIIEKKYQSINLPSLSDEKLFASFKELIEIDYTYVESEYFQTIYNASNAKLEFLDVLKPLRKIDESLEFVNLISELGELKVTGPARFIESFAADILKGHVGLVKQLNEILSGDKKISLQDLKFNKFLHDEMEKFVALYYFHSERELDLFVCRWGENLRFPLRTLASVIEMNSRMFVINKNNKAQIYSTEKEKLRSAFAKSWERLIPGSYKKVLTKLELVRNFLWLREELRDRSTRMYYFIRLHLLEIGQRLKVDDLIFNNSYQEVLSFLENTIDKNELVQLATRRQLYAQGFSKYVNSNEIGFRFNHANWKAKSTMQNGKETLLGIGSSAGVITGIARVIPDISQATSLLPGEIMVVPFTDPGWTPLFSLAAGVVTETGGLLSHAALISREYGIPCVLNVNGAVSKIKSGDRIEIDGTEGRVTLL
jgi:pyruvate,water dikinase